MAISISGSNAMSGLSGMDTNFDDVLAKLKQVERTKLNRLEAWKSDWQLRYDAFGEVIEQFNAASSMLSTLSNKNNFVTKNVASTDEGVVTAIANADAQDVQHAIEVLQVANNAVWANTSAFFATKDEVMVTAETEFKLTYAGKDFTVKLGKNTTLDSFASIINNSASNPGVKVNIVKTQQGYTYQIAGKDTGVENDLVINSNPDIKGMDPSKASSVWQNDASLNLTDPQTNPTSYTYDLVLNNGSTKSVQLNGNLTEAEVITNLNNAAGGINARIDGGNLVIDGVSSFSVRKTEDSAYKNASVTFTIDGRNNDKLVDGDVKDLSFEVVVVDPFGNESTREFTIASDSSKADFFAQIWRSTQGNDNVSMYQNVDNITMSLANVKSISQTGTSSLDSKYDIITSYNVKDSGYTAPTTNTGNTYVANDSKLTLTFSATSTTALTTDSKPLRYTIIKDDNSAVYIDFTEDEIADGDANYGKLQEKLKAAGLTYSEATDSSGNSTITLDNASSFRLTSGKADMSGVSASLKSSTAISENVAFQGTNDQGERVIEVPPDIEYTISLNDGSKATYVFASGTTMQTILQHISAGYEEGSTPLANGLKAVKDITKNGAPATSIASVTIKAMDSNGKEVALNNITPGEKYSFKLNNVDSLVGKNAKGQIVESSNWSIQRATNAIYTIDNWPVQMESASNQVSDAIEGVVFTIQETGKARINVTTDIASVEQSIQNFLDSVNSVLITIRELTKVDPDKEVTSNDPNDKGNPNYSMSGLTTEKGGLLTGNYGVQLLKTRLTSLLSSSPPGFKSRTSADDVLSGDALAILANMGIKMNSNETSEMYGLLEIAPDSSIAAIKDMDRANYEDMINNQLSAVVDFFCTSGTGASSSPDFRYGSHIAGITKAGIYDVSYECDANGNISNVLVNGEKAIYDPSQPGNYYSVANGDAKGLSFNIDSTSAGSHSGQIRIKEGMVQTVNNFLKAELKYTSVNLPADPNDTVGIQAALDLKSSNGALMVLRENYRNIMENIDVAIEREQRRLNTWEARQKKIFANLETLLAQYSEQQTSLESQLKQINGNSK